MIGALKNTLLGFVFGVLGAVPGATQEAMTFDSVGLGGNCLGCSWIAAEGLITHDTPAAFRAFRALFPYGGQVVFNSPGGNLEAALELGRLIRTEGLYTAVGDTIPPVSGGEFGHDLEPGTCESACFFAFIGGVGRTVVGDPEDSPILRSGVIGLHRFYTSAGGDIPSTATQAIVGRLLLHVLEMGVDPEVLAIASRTPADSMYHLSAAEARALRVETGGGGGPYRLAVIGNGLAAFYERAGDSGLVEGQAHLYCDSTLQAWVLEVRDIGSAGTTPMVSQENSDSVSFETAGGAAGFSPSDILDLTLDGEDWRLRLRLGVDLATLAGQGFRFRTGWPQTRWEDHLSMEGMVPDAQTLALLQRACVS